MLSRAAFTLLVAALLTPHGFANRQAFAQGESAGAADANAAAEQSSDANAAPPQHAARLGTNQSPLPVLRNVAPNADPPEREVLPIPGKIVRYAKKLVEKYDADGDGVLQQEEWSRMSGTPRLADLDGDGIVTVEELAERIASYSRQRSLRLMPTQLADLPSSASAIATPAPAVQQGSQQGLAGFDESEQARAEAIEAARRARRFYVPRSRLPGGIAEWFLEKDADGDGQITMAEFSQNWSQFEAAEFTRYDLNGDGVITPDEFVRAHQQRQAEQDAAAAAEAARIEALPGGEATPQTPQP